MGRRAICLLSILAFATLGLDVPARTPPGRMMANVYLLAQAGAILDICLANPEIGDAKAEELTGLAERLGGLVKAIATHYGDAELQAVYRSTKAEMAADPKLRFHVKNNHRNCGERLREEMGAYIAENEALIYPFVERKRPGAPR